MAHCIVPGCDQKYNSRRRLPNPFKYRSRFEQWLDVTGREDLKKVDPSKVFRSHRVCGIHFKPDDTPFNNRLHHLGRPVVPSLFLPKKITTFTPPDNSDERSLDAIEQKESAPNEIVPNEIETHEIALNEIELDELVPEDTRTNATLTDQIQMGTGNTNRDDFRFIPEKVGETMLMLETEDLKVAEERNVVEDITRDECRASNKVFIKALHRFPTRVPVGEKICVVLVCRICLDSVIPADEAIKLSMESPVYIEVSDGKGETKDVSLLQMLSVVLPQVEIRPNMKTVLCKNCVSSLHTSYQLMMNWTKTEKRLQECLEQQHLRYDPRYDLTMASNVQVVDNGTPQEEAIDLDHEVESPDCEPRPTAEETKSKSDSIERGDDSYLCAQCGEVFQELQPFEHHTNTGCHKGSQKRKASEASAHPVPKRTSRYQCGICNEVFGTREVLEHHLNTSHPGMPETPHQCEHYGNFFTSMGDLQAHLDTHRNAPSQYKCNFCGQLYRRRSDMMTHRKQMHFSELEQLRKCNICGISLADEENLNRHMMVYHMVLRGNQCQHCDKTYRYKKHLIEHLRKMHNEGKNASTSS